VQGLELVHVENRVVDRPQIAGKFCMPGVADRPPDHEVDDGGVSGQMVGTSNAELPRPMIATLAPV
jgi:hypothetical protein